MPLRTLRDADVAMLDGLRQGRNISVGECAARSRVQRVVRWKRTRSGIERLDIDRSADGKERLEDARPRQDGAASYGQQPAAVAWTHKQAIRLQCHCANDGRSRRPHGTEGDLTM